MKVSEAAVLPVGAEVYISGTPASRKLHGEYAGQSVAVVGFWRTSSGKGVLAVSGKGGSFAEVHPGHVELAAVALRDRFGLGQKVQITYEYEVRTGYVKCDPGTEKVKVRWFTQKRYVGGPNGPRRILLHQPRAHDQWFSRSRLEALR